MAILQVKGMKGEEHTCRGGKTEMASASSFPVAPCSAKAPLLCLRPHYHFFPFYFFLLFPSNSSPTEKKKHTEKLGHIYVRNETLKKVKQGYGTGPGTE